MKRISLLAVLAVLFVVPHVAHGDQHGLSREQVLERIQAEQEAARRAIKNQLEFNRILDTKAPSGFVAAILGDSNPDYQRHRRQLALYSQQLAKAESRYRQSLTAQYIAATRGLSKEDAGQYLFEQRRRANELYTKRQREVGGQLAFKLKNASGDEQRAKALAWAQGMLSSSRLDQEMAEAAVRRHYGGDDSGRLAALKRVAATTKVTLRPSDIADGTLREAESFVRQEVRDSAIDEYRRLARGGVLINEQTGRPESGTVRQHMAEDAERALAAELNRKALRSSRYDILRFLATKDDRIAKSKEITQSIAETPEYQALDYLSPGLGNNNAEYYRSLALTVRHQEEGVDKWRTDFVPGSKFSTGAATAHRIAGTAGEMSLDQVDRRISRYHREADSVVTAFEAAAAIESKAARGQIARADPALLSDAQRQLLKAHGYITGQAGQERFTIPTGRQNLSGLKKDINLPGAHLLDMISAKSVTEMVVSTAVPQMAAGKVGALLEGLSVSQKAVATGVAATDLVAGMGVDAAFEYAEKGKVDLARIAIDSTLLQAGLGSAGRITGGVAGALTKRLKNPAFRKSSEAFLKEAMGLPSEAALQTYYQSAVQGTGLDYETFLSNLMNGAMSRRISGALDRGNAKLPGFIRKEVADGTDAGREMVERHAELETRRKRANERLGNIMGDDTTVHLAPDKPTGDGLTATAPPGALTREQLANRIGHALESNQITWPELKMLYADKPELGPVLAAVNDRRGKIFNAVVEPAKELARKDLDAEYRLRKKRLEANLAGDPQLKTALANNEAWRTRELELINTKPIQPGSTNITSDIDRSVKSERVRKYLKQLYREKVGRNEVPATSAQAYDVNEYIDVFPTINKLKTMQGDLAALPAGGNFKGLNHAQAVEAQGMATAMLHMTKAQRDKYRENVLKAAADDQSRRLLQQQLSSADSSLSRADKEMETEIGRLAKENPNLARNPADLALRARDNLYGKRTEAIREKTTRMELMEAQLAKMDKTSLEAQKLDLQRKNLAAEIHRDWGYALREGIETYSSFTGLDTVVNDAQLSGRSIRDLINDNNYTREGLADQDRPLSDGQLKNFLNDQIMMMTHHMNGFQEGHEGGTDAGSAMGKYAERAVLALKMMGKDLSKEPYKSLNEAAEAMVKNRKDPAALKKVMTDLGKKFAGKADADAGLLALSDMVQKAIPEAAGLWDPKLLRATGESAGQTNMRRVRAQLANRRGLLEEEKRLLATHGPASAAAANGKKQLALASELEGLQAEKKRRENLGSKYRKKDWKRAEALESERNALTRRLARLEDLGAPASAQKEVRDQLSKVDHDLNFLNKAYRKAGGTGVYRPDEEDKRIENRIASIKQEQAERDLAAKDFAAKQAEEEKKIAEEPPFSDDNPYKITELPKDAISASGVIRVGLDGATAEIRIE